MKNILHTIVVLFLVNTCFAAGHPEYQSNKIYLEAGPIFTTNVISDQVLNDHSTDEFHGRIYRLVQFNHPLTLSDRTKVAAFGIRLLNYIPYNTWVASIPIGITVNDLRSLPVRTVLYLPLEAKKSKRLRDNDFPDYAVVATGQIDLKIRLQGDVEVSSVESLLKSLHVQVLSSHPQLGSITVRVFQSDIDRLARLSFVRYAEPISGPSIPEDTRGRSLHRSNTINQELIFGRHYNGDSVTISLADDGEVGPHIDFQGRLISLMNTGPGGNHGDMTSGIVVGAGNLDPTIRGMADGATILIHDIGPYDHIYNSPAFFNQYGAVITSTSYSQGCNDYNSDSQDADQLAFDNRLFTFVFSAGNRGQSDCGYGAGSPWGSITGGMKIGKNVISCANLDPYEVIDPTSSNGPADDGRIKPEIASNGADQLSTDESNTYQVGGGTSAACPGIAGVSAQLYQAYRSLYNNSNPDGAIIKSVLLNSAQDIGNTGPDFTYGFGRVNALRAARTLEEGRFRMDSLSHGDSLEFTVQVPAGAQQLKVMLYWPEVPGDPAAAFQLVNDMDVEVRNPGGTVELPWILDPTPNAVSLAAPAVKGIDHLNNVEQVAIDLPTAGTYTIKIKGSLVPSGMQRCYTTWDIVESAITLTYPYGGESFVPGTTELLRWDAAGTSGQFSLEYSLDAGSNWMPMVTLGGNIRQYEWTVPSVLSDQVVVRISRGATSDQSDGFITILPQPQNLVVDFACADTMQLSWTAAQGISSYQVYRLGLKYMDPIAAVTGTSVQLPIPGNSEEWFSVASVGPSGGMGRRLVAIQKQAGLVNCSYASDIAVLQMINPQAGLLYPCQSLSSVPVTVQLRNDGLADATGFSISYSINGGPPVVEVYSGLVPHGGSVNYTFGSTVDFSTPGTYSLDVSVTLAGDQNSLNDNLSISITIGVNASIPFAEDFQGAFYPPSGWSITNSGSGYQWSPMTTIGSNGASTVAAWFDDFSYNAPGAEDDMVMPVADFSALTQPILTFDVAYAVYGAGYDDGLKVEISTDCGATFLPTGYQKIGASLATVPLSATDWFPAAATDWRNDTVRLDAFVGQSVILKFININDYGNNLLVDNIQLKDNVLSSINESKIEDVVSVYPNPFSGRFYLSANGVSGGSGQLEIYDMQGRMLLSKPVLVQGGRVQETMDMTMQPSGIYFGQLKSATGVRSFRMIKH